MYRAASPLESARFEALLQRNVVMVKVWPQPYVSRWYKHIDGEIGLGRDSGRSVDLLDPIVLVLMQWKWPGPIELLLL